MVNKGTIHPNTGGTGRKSLKAILLTLTILMIVPAISRADTTVTTAETKDANADGHIDQIVVTLSAVPTQWAASDFNVEAGYRPILDVTQGSGANNAKFTLTVSPKSAFDTGATPVVSYKGSDVTATDKAAPTLVGVDGDDLGGPSLFTNIGEYLKVQFSEPVSLQTTDATGTPVGPATTPADKLLSLERGLQLAGPTSGCGTDGDGTVTVESGQITPNRNFPSPSAAVNPNAPPDPNTNPVVIDGGLIKISMPAGYDGSGIKRRFNVTPASLPFNQHCTLNVFATLRASIADTSAAKNASVPHGGSAVAINHVKGELTDAATVDANANGKIDGIAVTFNHPAKFDSVKRALDLGHRIAIGDGTLSGANVRCVACEANPAGAATQVVLSFDETPSWNTASVPSVVYDGSGDCSGTGIQVVLVNGLNECAGSFTKASVDKARPVLIGAKTRDLGTDPLSPAPNGKLDTVELTFSEPVTDSTFATTSAWSLSGYTVNAFHTGSTANDAVGLLQFNEVGIDTANITGVTYTQPTGTTDSKVADPNGNLLSNIAAPGVAATDGAGPALVSGQVLDAVGSPDGRIDTAKLTFSEPILDEPIVASKIHVAKDSEEKVATSVSFNAGVDPKQVTAIVAGGVRGTDAKDLSVLAGAVFDAAGNAAPALSLAAASVQDLAKPVAIEVTPQGQSGQSQNVTITFSEKMDAATTPSVKFGQAAPFDDVTIAPVQDGSHSGTSGYQTADTSKWDGVAPEPEGGATACTVPSGCDNTISISNVKGADGFDSAFAPDTRYSWTIDTVAPSGPPAFTSPANGGAVTTNGTTADVPVAGTSTEDNLTIQVYEGDTLRGSTLSNSSGNWSVTLPTLSLGAHALKLRAVDAGGNATSFSGLRTVYVKQNTTTTIARSASSVVYGYATTISGVVRNAGGAALTNRLVTIQYLPAGTSSWRNLASIRTDSSGGYAYAYRASTSNSYRTVYGGEATFAPSTSPVTFVALRAAVSSAQSATSVRLGNTVTFTGGVRPATGLAGKRVYLQVQNANGSWSNVGYVYLDRSSNYKIVYKPSARGTRYYRIYYPRQTSYLYEYWSVTRRIAVS